MRFLVMAAGTFGAAAIALTLQRQIGAPYWAYYGIAAAFAALLNVAFNLSRRRYLGRFEWWEHATGRVITPKWIELMNAVGICFALAIPFELLASLLRK